MHKVIIIFTFCFFNLFIGHVFADTKPKQYCSDLSLHFDKKKDLFPIQIDDGTKYTNASAYYENNICYLNFYYTLDYKAIIKAAEKGAEIEGNVETSDMKMFTDFTSKQVRDAYKKNMAIIALNSKLYYVVMKPFTSTNINYSFNKDDIDPMVIHLEEFKENLQ